MLEISREIEEKGAELVSLMDNIDTTTTMGKAMFGILAVLAEMEKNLIAERSRAGQAIALREDSDGQGLRRLAKRSKDAGQSRRLLALSVIYDGGRRTDAARIGCVGFQCAEKTVPAIIGSIKVVEKNKILKNCFDR